jgi:CheY-like chemotaxis protein
MRILIHEPEENLRALLRLQLEHLGHEPVLDVQPRIDAAVIETAHAPGRELAHRLRASSPWLPLVFVSILPPCPETVALSPRAHLTKPAPLTALAAALAPPSANR